MEYTLEYEFEDSDGQLREYDYELEPEEIEALGINPDEYDVGENYNILLGHFEAKAEEAFREWDEQKDSIDCEVMAQVERELGYDPIHFYFTCEICGLLIPRYCEGATPTTCCHCNPERPEEEETPTHNEIV